MAARGREHSPSRGAGEGQEPPQQLADTRAKVGGGAVLGTLVPWRHLQSPGLGASVRAGRRASEPRVPERPRGPRHTRHTQPPPWMQTPRPGMLWTQRDHTRLIEGTLLATDEQLSLRILAVGELNGSFLFPWAPPPSLPLCAQGSAAGPQCPLLSALLPGGWGQDKQGAVPSGMTSAMTSSMVAGSWGRGQRPRGWQSAGRKGATPPPSSASPEASVRAPAPTPPAEGPDAQIWLPAPVSAFLPSVCLRRFLGN